MNSAFTALPQFEIVQIEKSNSVIKYSGIVKNLVSFTKTKSGSIAVICANQNNFIEGRFSEVNLQDFQVTIEVSDVDSQKYLEIGKDYPLLDGYWGELTELVFDNSIIWKRHKFEPHDSTVHYPDGRVEIAKDGWDHEHCRICLQKISTFETDKNYGYVNQSDHWLCESCYQNYVLKKSLDFIYLNQLF
jgi:hypothetical protein